MLVLRTEMQHICILTDEFCHGRCQVTWAFQLLVSLDLSSESKEVLQETVLSITFLLIREAQSPSGV